jgi:hypothetical protein
MDKPYLLVDIDGVVSLFAPNGPLAADAPTRPRTADEAPVEGPIEGAFHSIDGIPHFLSFTAASHLLRLSRSFELVWASGWEEKAEEHLPRLLGLPTGLPFITFARPATGQTRTTHAHWKLESISEFAGGRPLAWVDDAFNPACHEWAGARGAPTLLVSTSPERGLTATETATLLEWARLQAPQ